MTFEINRPTKDYLWLHLKDLPYFRAILRAVEARQYPSFDLQHPILDIGCGDGHFVTIAMDDKVDVGIDPWTGPVRLARKNNGYNLIVQGSGYTLPFPDNYFNSALSNSVLEHIPDLDTTLREISRVLKPGARFVFCVPNDRFLANLSISGFFDSIGWKFLGDWYRKFFNQVCRHIHCDTPDVWENRLDENGLEIERWWHYFSPKALHILEWGHYFGLPSLLIHFVTRKWNLVNTRWNFILTNKIVEPVYREKHEQPDGVYSFYIVKKKGG
jgi:SAM-dependent methyltransferase